MTTRTALGERDRDRGRGRERERERERERVGETRVASPTKRIVSCRDSTALLLAVLEWGFRRRTRRRCGSSCWNSSTVLARVGSTFGKTRVSLTDGRSRRRPARADTLVKVLLFAAVVSFVLAFFGAARGVCWCLVRRARVARPSLGRARTRFGSLLLNFERVCRRRVVETLDEVESSSALVAVSWLSRRLMDRDRISKTTETRDRDTRVLQKPNTLSTQRSQAARMAKASRRDRRVAETLRPTDGRRGVVAVSRRVSFSRDLSSLFILLLLPHRARHLSAVSAVRRSLDLRVSSSRLATREGGLPPLSSAIRVLRTPPFCRPSWSRP